MEVHNSYFLLVRVFVPVPMFFGTACSRRENESEGEGEGIRLLFTNSVKVSQRPLENVSGTGWLSHERRGGAYEA